MEQDEIIKKMQKFVDTRLHPYKFDKDTYAVEYIYLDLEAEGFEGEKIYTTFRVRARKGEWRRLDPKHRRRRKNMLNGL